MGHVNDAAYFVAPAYALTFAMFATLGLVSLRRLSVWARRARDEEEHERVAAAREGQSGE